MNSSIALVNPPLKIRKSINPPCYPVGLGYLQASCSRNGINCDVFDFTQSVLTYVELITKYTLDQYPIIGITSYSLDFNSTVEFIHCLKKHGCTIIVGGHHANLLGKKLLVDFECIDYVLMGYGEYSFPLLINKIINNDSSFTEIPGLCYRLDSCIRSNPINYSSFDLDEIAIPNRNLIIYDIDKRFVVQDQVNTLAISSSRGCPYRCAYCVNCDCNYWLKRSIENVLSEIQEEMDKKEYSLINFVDCNFFIDPQRAIEIIRFISYTYPQVEIIFQTRADQICHNSKLFDSFKNIPLTVEVGIESNSLEVLKRYNKKTTPAINQQAIDILRRNNITAIPYIIMFEALETLEDIRKNFDFIKTNKFYSYNAVINLYQTMMPFWGTSYFNEYGSYYKGNFHERMTPCFVDTRVSLLWDSVYCYRNMYEDRVNKMIKDWYVIFSDESLHNKSIDDNLRRFYASIERDINKIVLFNYKVFEFFLIMAERYSLCDYRVFANSKLGVYYVELLESLEKRLKTFEN